MLLPELYTRIYEGAKDVYHLNNLAPWVEKNIILEGDKVCLQDKYKFQADILNDTSRVNNTIKPAQIGMTTITIAYFLAGMSTQRKFNVIYALPTANDAMKLTNTKVNPLVYGSPRVKSLLNSNVDSLDLKQINGNFLYIRGTKSETAALSVSADCLVADEIDRSDPDTLKQFRSRLQASDLKIIRQFSTPTIPNVGIAKEAETSKRYKHIATCTPCGYKWLPSYHSDMVIPGYDKGLEELTKHNIKDVRWQEAHWRCPSCGRDPRFDPKNLEWVVENPLENYEAHTYYITPVTACKVLTPAYLVRTSTEFNTRAEWQNQVLGEPAEDSTEQLGTEDILSSLVNEPLESSEIHCLGADMGLMCAVTIGRKTLEGQIVVVHKESVPIGMFEQRRRELIRQYRVVVSVHDAYPYTPTIMGICDFDPNAWGCDFSATRSPLLFTTRQKDENREDGTLNLRLVKGNRTLMLDAVRDYIKAGMMIVRSNSEDQKFVANMLSLKRTMQMRANELTQVWEKTDGEDHYMFALAYLNVAIHLLGTTKASDWSSMPLVSKFKMKPTKV